MDRFDRIEELLDKLAKLQAEADQQRAKDKAEADQQRAKDKAEADLRKKEADRRLANNEQLISDLRKSIKEMGVGFNNLGKNVRGIGVSIGEITEAITVSSKIIQLVNKFAGIKVDSFLPNIEKTRLIDPDGELEGDNRRQFEIDGLAVGKSEAVVIEAKTKLEKGDVDSFIKLLNMFKDAFDEYKDRDIYACVAFVRANDKTLAYAEKRGLFVIRATPPDVKLINGEGFKPVKFA